MSDFVLFMAAPFAACLVIVSLHAYLGLHVLPRGVIFVDLALAQLAALGALIGLMLGYEAGGAAAYALALGATLAGAAVFAVVGVRQSRISQEAIIGIVYVVAAAATILLLDRAAHGAEQLKDALVGQILWVSWDQVLRIAAVYLVMAGLYRALHRRFASITLDAAEERVGGVRVRLWDFLFYATFGFVITLSVPLAGVLLVFSFLIVPAVCATLVCGGLAARLGVAWAVGAGVSFLGCAVSYFYDLPTGATIVCVFGGVLALFGVWRLRR